MKTPRPTVALKPIGNLCNVCHARDFCMASCLSQDDLERFDGLVGHHAPMSKGERLYMAGDDINSLFVLHSGSVKSYVESSDGDNQITGFHLPGDIIGIHGIEKKVHTDTIEALETSSVCELRFSNFEDICEAFPSLHRHLLRFVFRGLSHEQDMLLVLGKMSAERRLAYFLLDITARLAEHGLSNKFVNLTMTRHDIANYLGLAVETVSRILTRMQESSIIRVDRRTIEIMNEEQLRIIYNGNRPSAATTKQHDCAQHLSSLNRL